MREDILVGLLRTWYTENKDNPRKWSKSPAGKAIKATVKSLGYWKNQPRGNPAKGYAKSKKNKEIRGQAEEHEQDEEYGF